MEIRRQKVAKKKKRVAAQQNSDALIHWEECTDKHNAKMISARSDFLTLWRRKAHRKSRDDRGENKKV